MNIVRGHISDYTLRFRKPLSTATGTFADRTGVVLTLEDDQGRRGVGDAAPLPGFSPETIEEARAALQQLLAKRSPLWRSSFASTEAIRHFLIAHTFPSSSAHALDQALLDLLARRRGIPLCRLLAYNCRATVPVHALVQDRASAVEATEAGFSTLKIKAGADLLDDDDARIQAIRQAVGPQQQLRVDANGAWGSSSEASAALERLGRHGLCCVEQPVPARQLELLVQVRACSAVPIVADESVRTADDLEQIIERRAADAVVIKPMLCGGIQQAMTMARRALAAELPVSVTSTLESGVGRAAALHLAAAIPGPLWSCGLSDGGLLHDLLPPRHIIGGELPVPGKPGLGIDIDALTFPPTATAALQR